MDKKETKEDNRERRYQTIYGNTVDNFGKHLIGRILTFELANGKMITGKLKSFGQYDIIITDSRTGQDILVMKHALITVQGDLPIPNGKATQ